MPGCSGLCRCFLRFFSFFRFFRSLSSSWRFCFLCFFSWVSKLVSKDAKRNEFFFSCLNQWNQWTNPSMMSLEASCRLYACAFYVYFYVFVWVLYLSNDNVQVMVPDVIEIRLIAHSSAALTLCQQLVVFRLYCVVNCCPAK